NHLKSIAPGSAGLFVCDNPTAFKPWLLGRPDIGSFEGETVNTLLRPQYMPLLERFDFCWLAITRNNASSAASLVSRIGPMLRRGGLLLVSVDEEALEDRRQALADVLNMNLDVESVHYVAESSVVAALRQALKGLYGLAMTPPWTPVPVFAAGPLSALAQRERLEYGLRAPPQEFSGGAGAWRQCRDRHAPANAIGPCYAASGPSGSGNTTSSSVHGCRRSRLVAQTRTGCRQGRA